MRQGLLLEVMQEGANDNGALQNDLLRLYTCGMAFSNDHLTQIQQTFVRRFMADERILGVRIVRLGDDVTLVIDADPDGGPLDLPAEFDGVPVVVRDGRRAALAYATSH